jgi:TatD DNase family protein
LTLDAAFGLIDTHAHLDARPFANDLPGVLERAEAAGVRQIINVGIDVESSRAAIRLAEGHANIWATVGVHPHDAAKLYPADLEELRDLARHPRVVAIGETGLDFYRDLSPRSAQLAAFRLHLDLARDLSLPVIIHDRDAHEEVLQELRRWTALRPGGDYGVLHCFSGSAAMAREAVELGFYIAVGGPITYRPQGALVEAVQQVPLERLLLETDCPYLPPEPYRGRRNEPAYLERVAREVARVRWMSVEELVDATSANASRLFGGIC